MKTKFFRKNASVKAGALVRRLLRLRLAMTALLLWPMVLAAQNGITLSGLVMDAGTVTFNVSWKNTGMPAIWSDTVWVFVDHNVNGTMVRLPLVAGSTLTATSAQGTGQVKDELASGNNKGVWVIGNARVANTFSATVKLLTSNQNVSGACVYASNYPPVGTFLSAGIVSFTGTQPFSLVLQQIGGSGTINGSSTNGYYYMPGGYELKSFTDKTGAPGRWSCHPSDIHTLTVSATEYCAGTTVTFALSNTTLGQKYRLYNGSTPVMDALTGTGSAATFTGTFAGGGQYTAQVLAEGGNCAAVMTGSHMVYGRNLPTQPTISATDVCFNGGDLVFTASGHYGVVEWVSTGGGAVNGNSVTFASGVATGTKTVVARSAQSYSTLTCYSANVSKSANVNPLPTAATVTGNSRCDAGTVTLMAGSSGAVIDWYAAASGDPPLLSGNNTYTTPSIDASTTYYAQARIEATSCVSAVPRTAVLAAITNTPTVPSAPEQDGPKCAGTAITFSATVPSGATGLDWTGSVSGTGTSKTTATTAAGTYSAQVRSYLSANDITCYSNLSSSTSGVINTIPTIARTGGAATQSVSQNSAITAITYTASNATSISRGGSLPTGVNGSISGTTLTIRGTPSATGTFGYTVSASHTNGCVSTTSTGTITVAAVSSGPFNTATTWLYGGLTWSDRVVAKPSNCASTTTLTMSNNTTAEYKIDNSTGVDRYYYSWTCATGGTYGGTNAQLCPAGWRLPAYADFKALANATDGSILLSAWGDGGYAYGPWAPNGYGVAYYWSSVKDEYPGGGYFLTYEYGSVTVPGDSALYLGFQVRCVK